MAKEQSNRKANAIGINHVALEVDNIDQAVAFYGEFLEFEVESCNESAAFVYFGDQFMNFMTSRTQSPDQGRHFGIAVDDKKLVRETLIRMGVELLDMDPKFLDFLDPWGNRVEITTYQNIQFTKADHVLMGMGLHDIQKTKQALAELREKGMGPPKHS